MLATVFHGPFDVRVEQVRDAALQEPTDALVRITHAAICGSDLWPYRGLEPFPPGGRLGHEWMGMVEDVGSQVTTIKRGDRVIAPFAFSDGTCEFCRRCAGRTARSFCCARSHRRSRWRSLGRRGDGYS